MKKNVYIILLLFLFRVNFISQAQDINSFNQDSTSNYKTPPYKLALGIRFPFHGIMIDPGVSAKYFIGKKNALEANFGWNVAWHNFTTGLYATRNHRLFKKNNLRLYYGAGLSGVSTEANMRTNNWDDKMHFYIGVGITGGLEYPLPKKPFVFGAEYRQAYFKFPGQDINGKYFINTTVGLTAKYLIK